MASPGSFYFAWVSSAETAFNGSHLREDELIFSFEMKHEEGQVAELELEIINPHIGLLYPGRPLWAWFSWHDGGSAHPLFFGRLVGVPDDLTEEIITVKFVAKPKNYAEQQLALAESLKVLPHYDPIFIDEKKLGDPNTVLEGYSALWHVDRISHQVTISDIIAGEDGIAEFTAADVFYDEVSIKLAGAPLMVCEIEAEVQWVQTSNTGIIEFQTKPGLTGSSDLGNGLTAENSSFSSGFSGLGQYNVEVQQPKEPEQYLSRWIYINMEPGPHADGDIMESGGTESVPNYGGQEIKRDENETPGNKETGQGYEYQISQTFQTDDSKPITVSTGDPFGGGSTVESNTDQQMKIAVELEQDRTERIHVRIVADVQPVLTEANEDEDSIKESLSMTARDVVEAGAANGSDGAYFPTDRGLRSLEYLLMVARAHLLSGSRVLEVTWGCPFAKVIDLSCRKNATVEDSRLPGGIVLGKVVAYQISGNGDDGEFVGEVTINSAVGNGSSVVAAEGTPDYVDVGYVDPGYQHYSGMQVLALTNDMTFEPLAYEATGIQLPISKDQILVRHEYIDTGRSAALSEVYAAAKADPRSDPSYGRVLGVSSDYSDFLRERNTAINKAIFDHPVWVEIEMKPVQNISTDVEYDAATSALMIPKQADLASPSTP